MKNKKIIWALLAFIVLMFFGAALLHAQGPVAAYGFNENTGTSAGDASGNSQIGTINGATWTTGKYGSALSFNGTSSKVTVADSANLHLTNRWTIEVWINPAIVSASSRDIIVKGGNNYYISNISSGRVIAGGLAGSTWAEAYGTSTLPVNTWTHVAATYDGANIRLYQNAVEVRVRAFVGSFTVTTKALEIGWNSTYAGQFFSGKIDEIRIYNRALTPAEIQTDMNTPIAPTPPADTTPPVISAGSPTGVLASTTTQATLSVTTNENATCRYATTAGVAYTAMLNTFGTTGIKAHSSVLIGLQSGASYNYFIRCIDGSGNSNSSDYLVSFSIALAPPVISITDSNPDAPLQITWDYDPNFQSQVNGFSLYASDSSSGPWTFYNGIPDATKRIFSFISPDKDTYFTMDACKQTSPTAGYCSSKSNVVKIHCIPLTETFLWQTYTVRKCQ